MWRRIKVTNLILGCAMLDNKPRIQKQAMLNIHRATIIMNKIFSWILMLFSYLIFTNSSFAAPPTIEIFSGSGTGQQGPRANTTAHTFLLNRNNPSDNVSEAYAPTTTVSYTITNSVYNRTPYAPANNSFTRPDIFMGGILMEMR